MNRKPSKIRWRSLKETDKERLLYLVAQWFVSEQRSHSEIAVKMANWVKKNAHHCYNPDGDNVSTSFVGRRIAEAVEHRFLQVGRFHEQKLAEKIQDLLTISQNRIKIIVAPDRNQLLRYVWLDLDHLLMEMVKTKSVVIGISGGRTMLALAKAATSLTDLTWHNEVPVDKRAKVIVCSLTSGGIRTNIAALSDTVAANIAEYLGARTRGLLGPAWFADKSALRAFCNDQGVKEHIELVKKADIILTSIGYLGDSNALMRQLLTQADESKFVEERPNLADMLYQCYDGLSGQPIKLPGAIADRVFSVIDLKQLHKMVQKNTLCIVLAVGEEKGQHALAGVLKAQMASHVYMDRACAEGLIQTLS